MRSTDSSGMTLLDAYCLLLTRSSPAWSIYCGRDVAQSPPQKVPTERMNSLGTLHMQEDAFSRLHKVLVRGRLETVGMSVYAVNFHLHARPDCCYQGALERQCGGRIRTSMLSTIRELIHRLIRVQLRSAFRDSMHNPQTFRPRISAQQAYKQSELLEGRIRSSTPLSHQPTEATPTMTLTSRRIQFSSPS